MKMTKIETVEWVRVDNPPDDDVQRARYCVNTRHDFVNEDGTIDPKYSTTDKINYSSWKDLPSVVKKFLVGKSK